MLIGLLSDTHVASTNQKLPRQLLDALKGVDIILHAGDIWIPSVLDELETVAPVKAAMGDDDLKADLGNDKRVADTQTLSFDGFTLWLTHIKPHYGIINPNSDLYSSESRSKHSPDIIIFGHTHRPTTERYANILLVNPGSPTFPSYMPKLGTIGLLDLNSGGAEVRIVQL